MSIPTTVRENLINLRQKHKRVVDLTSLKIKTYVCRKPKTKMEISMCSKYERRVPGDLKRQRAQTI